MVCMSSGEFVYAIGGMLGGILITLMIVVLCKEEKKEEFNFDYRTVDVVKSRLDALDVNTRNILAVLINPSGMKYGFYRDSENYIQHLKSQVRMLEELLEREKRKPLIYQPPLPIGFIKVEEAVWNDTCNRLKEFEKKKTEIHDKGVVLEKLLLDRAGKIASLEISNGVLSRRVESMKKVIEKLIKKGRKS